MNMTQVATEGRADWPLLRHGAVTLFRRTDLFERAKADLSSLGYDVISIRCETVAKLVTDLSEALRWEEQFGYSPWSGNLDALNDGVGNAQFPPSRSVAFAFERYDLIADQNSDFAQAVLDVLERQARDHLIAGERIVALVQTDDPSFVADNLGSRAATWNSAESMIADRR